MDLINADKRQSTFEQFASEIRSKCASAGWHDNVRIFGTSIWDETLYSAWSDIVATLNPHVTALATYLTRFAHVCSAVEVVLFERTTMLVISQSSAPHTQPTDGELVGQPDWPEDRFAKISQAIKLFRLGCKWVSDTIPVQTSGVMLRADPYVLMLSDASRASFRQWRSSSTAILPSLTPSRPKRTSW